MRLKPCSILHIRLSTQPLWPLRRCNLFSAARVLHRGNLSQEAALLPQGDDMLQGLIHALLRIRLCFVHSSPRHEHGVSPLFRSALGRGYRHIMSDEPALVSPTVMRGSPLGGQPAQTQRAHRPASARERSHARVPRPPSSGRPQSAHEHRSPRFQPSLIVSESDQSLHELRSNLLVSGRLE